MAKVIAKEIAMQDKVAERSTFDRVTSLTPLYKKINDNQISFSIGDKEAIIGELEEAILYIIAVFRFSPIWLVKKWLEENYPVKGESNKIIENWLDVGLIFPEGSAICVYLRPTKFLLDIIGDIPKEYTEISEPLMKHYVTKQQVMFDIITGNENSQIYYALRKEENLLKGYHPMGIEGNDKGTITIVENSIKAPIIKPSDQDLIDQENQIINEIRNGEEFTDEFSDFSKFIIVYNNNGKLGTQLPDLIVPIKRDHGRPMSWAIEVEISPKPIEKYKNIFMSYANNIKYGTLVYIMGPGRVRDRISRAYKEVKDQMGNTKVKFIDIDPPTISLEYWENVNLTKKIQEINEEKQKDKERIEKQKEDVKDLFVDIAKINKDEFDIID